MCSSVDYWRCRWIKLGGALEYPQRGPSGPHPGPDLSTACPQGYPQGWKGGTRRCGSAHTPSRAPVSTSSSTLSARPVPCPFRAPEVLWPSTLPAPGGPRPLPCTGGPDAAARGQLGDPPPSPRAGGRGGWLFLFDRGSPGVPPRHPLAPGACPRAVLPGRSRWGRSEAGGSRKDDAPSPPHPDARSDRGARRRTASGRHRGPGSGRGAEGVFRLNACGRARGRRCVRDRRPACSAAGADGPL